MYEQFEAKKVPPHDLAILMTNSVGAMVPTGMAPVGSICKLSSSFKNDGSVVVFYDDGMYGSSMRTATHEIGHK